VNSHVPDGECHNGACMSVVATSSPGAACTFVVAHSLRGLCVHVDWPHGPREHVAATLVDQSALHDGVSSTFVGRVEGSALHRAG